MPRSIEKRCKVRGKGNLPSGLPKNLSCKKARSLVRCTKKLKGVRGINRFRICKSSIL